jgi:anaerobic ribonucleoside-triphosphate reductase activating protein
MEYLRELLLSQPHHDGVTFSGGEPMLQARALLALWQQLRETRPEWTLIVFSGFQRERLLTSALSEQQALLLAADAFVGGPYIARLNDNRGLRGSSNQEIWFAPHARFTAEQREAMQYGPRRVELRWHKQQLLWVGIPVAGWQLSAVPRGIQDE